MNIDLTVLCDVVPDPRRQQYQTQILVMIVTLSQHALNTKQTCFKL